VLRVLVAPAVALAIVTALAWPWASTWYALATTTTTTAVGTSTGEVVDDMFWPLPSDVTVRFQTADRTRQEADIATLRSLPKGTRVPVAYSVADPGKARLDGAGDGIGRGAGIALAVVVLLGVWARRRARAAAAGVRAPQAAAEMPPNPALGLLTAEPDGGPLLLLCAPVVSPLRFHAMSLLAPLPHGVAARFASNPGLELRLRGRLAAGETVLAEVGGAVLRPAGPVWLPDTDDLVVLLDSVGALTRSADDDT
jgi:hypothetical protein